MEQRLQALSDAISDQTIAVTLTRLRDELIEVSSSLSKDLKRLNFVKSLSKKYPWECYIEIPHFFNPTDFLKLMYLHGYIDNFNGILYTVAHTQISNLSEKLPTQALYSVIANCEVVKPFSPERRRKLTDLVIRCVEDL